MNSPDVNETTVRAAAPPQEPLRPPVILVAEDDEDICHVVELNMRRLGASVVTAHDGDTALELALEHVPDVAVLDVMMPGRNGFEVTRALRADERTAEMHIVLLTARAGKADMQHATRVGADHYLVKPFGPPELRELVNGLLPRRKKTS